MITTQPKIELRPTVTLLTTGGTIAGISDTSKRLKYVAKGRDGEYFANSIKGLAEIAKLNVVPVANIASQDMSEEIWAMLIDRISMIRRVNPDSAIVITHGTDTMEETAFLLDLLFPNGPPIVLTGSMRAGDDVSADGPRNVLDAVRVAIDVNSRDQGALIVLNGEIHAARYASKSHTENVQAFSSGAFGLLGEIVNGKPFFRHHAGDRRSKMCDLPIKFSIPLPKVGIIYAHAASDSDLVPFFARQGYLGIVLAGLGNGNTNASTLSELAKYARDKTVVRASRLAAGTVSRNVEVDDDASGFLVAGDLSPQKARILLQLLLRNPNSRQNMQKAFLCHAS